MEMSKVYTHYRILETFNINVHKSLPKSASQRLEIMVENHINQVWKLQGSVVVSDHGYAQAIYLEEERKEAADIDAK